MPSAQELNEPQVAEDLELLPDFRLDVFVAGMKAGQITRKSVNVGQRKRCRGTAPRARTGFLYPPDDVQYVQRPAAGVVPDLGERAQPGVLLPDVLGICRNTIGNQGNSCVRRNVGKQNVAAHPSVPAGGGTEGRPFLKAR
jgi:hypothetical protein